MTLGRYVMMAPRVVILGRNHRTDDLTVPMISQGDGPPKGVVVEDDVWIGTGAIILPGRRTGAQLTAISRPARRRCRQNREPRP